MRVIYSVSASVFVGDVKRVIVASASCEAIPVLHAAWAVWMGWRRCFHVIARSEAIHIGTGAIWIVSLGSQ
jgi:hypothetical protein